MTQRIQWSTPGDRLSARYVNRIVDAANLAIEVLGPARSNRRLSTDSFAPQLDSSGSGSLVGLGTRQLNEVSRSESLVRIFSPVDASVYVDFLRMQSVTFTDGNEMITLNFQS